MFLLSLAATAQLSNIRENIGEENKLVFAHYMVCCPTAGHDASVDDFKKEIREAQSRGIDGFALNCGGWSVNEPHYKARVLRMFEAAMRMNTGFKLFISADGKAQEEIADIVMTVSELPAQLKVNGKPVLSTFGGEGDLGLRGGELISNAQSIGAFFIPYFFPRPLLRELPTDNDARELAQRYGNADGFFYFGAAGVGAELAESNSVSARAWRKRSKVFMASVTPYYIGGGRNFRVFETEGFKSMAAEWEAAIRSDANWVQIVTWNDWYESTYVAPFAEQRPDELPNRDLVGRLLPHVAYLDASKYYIDWFKTGKKPVLTKDQLFYFYRLHPKSEKSDISFSGIEGKGLPKGINGLKDNVYVSAFLLNPGQVSFGVDQMQGCSTSPPE